jgi:hypothetical protein
MTLTFLALAALLQTPKADEEPKWERYKSPAGFSVLLPAAPVEQRQPLANQKENVTLISKSGALIYMVIKVANDKLINTKALEAELFDKEVHEGMVKAGKVLSEKTIARGGHPGREYQYEMTAQNGKVFVVHNQWILMSPETTYNLQVIRPKEIAAPAEGDVTSFFESLKLEAVTAAPKPADRPKLAFKSFVPKGAGFSILLPGKPDETTQENKSATGSFKLHAYECPTVAGAYSISVLDYGPGVADAPEEKKMAMLTQFCQNMLAKDKGTVADQVPGEFQGFPQKIMRYTFPIPGSLVMVEIRAVMVGAKVFVVMARCPANVVNPADPDKFFESFKLTNAKAEAVASDDAPAAATRRGRAAAAPRLAGRMPGKGAAPTRPSRAAAAPARAPRPERISWKRYNSAAGGFTINMPGDPTPSHDDDGLLGSKGVEILTAEHEESRFIVQYQDLSRTAQKKGSSGVLKAARASDEKVIQGKVVGEKEATLKGAVGWSYQIETPEPDGPMARVRAYVVGTRLYQIIVVAPKTKFPTDDSERFLSSFKLQSRN